MARGNRKGSIFERDADRHLLLRTVQQATDRYEVRCLAFCLMQNHYHLVLDTPRGNLSDAMRHINGTYTQASNRVHQRTGHLFEGRFHSIVVDRDSYLRELARYVVLNPVRARLVGDPTAWPWSSYRATAGLEPAPSFLDVNWIEDAFGGGRLEAQVKYRCYVNDALTKTARLDMSPPVLGTIEFKEDVRAEVDVEQSGCRTPRSWRALARPSLSDLFGTDRLTHQERNQLVAKAHLTYGYRLSEIALFLRLHPSSASAIFRRLTDRSAEDFVRQTSRENS
jgi:REP element-mobilizing transposase RayT